MAARLLPAASATRFGVGLNPLVSQHMERLRARVERGLRPVDFATATNVLGFAGNIGTPTTSKFVATRARPRFFGQVAFQRHLPLLQTDGRYD